MPSYLYKMASCWGNDHAQGADPTRRGSPRSTPLTWAGRRVGWKGKEDGAIDAGTNSSVQPRRSELAWRLLLSLSNAPYDGLCCDFFQMSFAESTGHIRPDEAKWDCAMAHTIRAHLEISSTLCMSRNRDYLQVQAGLIFLFLRKIFLSS